ncbi:MAG: diguanylate cyclase [Candidatus Omnitrophica bacterium]|nr:diguanylate cyclase [Candidatus Omnitrophota bacterium]
MKIRTKLLVGFAAIIFLVLLGGVLSLVQLDRMAQPLHSEMPQNIKAVSGLMYSDTLAQLIRYYDEVLTQSARNYVFTHNAKWKNKFLETEPKLNEVIQEAVEKGDVLDKRIFDGVAAANRELIGTDKKALALVDAGNGQEAAVLLETGEYLKYKTAYEEGLGNYAKKRGRGIDEAKVPSSQILIFMVKKVDTLIASSRQIVIVFIALVIFVAALLFVFLAGSITRPILFLTKVVSRISQGELSERAVVDSWDEIGDLAHSFNRMADNLVEDIKNRREVEEELKTLIVHDSVTGLFNYKHFMDKLKSEFSRADRMKNHLSLVMLDIDYFRSVNDVYGHKMGDLVLKQVGEEILKSLRNYDLAARYGGEEFAVLSPETTAEQAGKLAQRVIDNLNARVFGDNNIKLKFSIGVANYPADKATRDVDLLILADRALAKAKEEGGNKVCLYGSVSEAGAAVQNGVTDVEMNELQKKIDKLQERANQSLVESIIAFAKTIEAKDHYTWEHVENVVLYATKIAKRLKLPEWQVEQIRRAATLHDLGKVGIKEEILNKQSRLTEIEYEEIKQHPRIAADILRPLHFLHDIIPLVLHHHEMWNGEGYPFGLKGEEIPLGARIIAVADVYQALISDRPYRKSFTKEEAMDILAKNSGTKFDPELVELFLEIVRED